MCYPQIHFFILKLKKTLPNFSIIKLTKNKDTKQKIWRCSMNNYTMDLYEIKREITTFSKKISKGLSKPISKFVMDMQYGISNLIFHNIQKFGFRLLIYRNASTINSTSDSYSIK